MLEYAAVFWFPLLQNIAKYAFFLFSDFSFLFFHLIAIRKEIMNVNCGIMIN